MTRFHSVCISWNIKEIIEGKHIRDIKIYGKDRSDGKTSKKT